jgi:hypothetical protein
MYNEKQRGSARWQLFSTGSGLGTLRLTFFPPPLVRRCKISTAGQGNFDDKGCHAKIPPWAVNLCPHYQAVEYGQPTYMINCLRYTS